MPKPNPRLMAVVRAFAKDRQVSHGGGQGFGSGALKLKGKIFAMMSSKGQFLVKLPKKRVDGLVSGGQGRTSTGGGRKMKEWLAIKATDAAGTSSPKKPTGWLNDGLNNPDVIAILDFQQIQTQELTRQKALAVVFSLTFSY